MGLLTNLPRNILFKLYEDSPDDWSPPKTEFKSAREEGAAIKNTHKDVISAVSNKFGLKHVSKKNYSPKPGEFRIFHSPEENHMHVSYNSDTDPQELINHVTKTARKAEYPPKGITFKLPEKPYAGQEVRYKQTKTGYKHNPSMVGMDRVSMG